MFLNGIMLAGLAGAAVPLILHLLNRARYRTVRWGAMMFLHEAEARKQHARRLKQLLLLLVRMALVGTLSMALARPVLSGALASVAGSSHCAAVILLDHSASMSAGRPGHTRLDIAQEIVRQLLGDLHRGDEAALIPLGDWPISPPAIVPPRTTTDLQSLLDDLDQFNMESPGWGVADMARGLNLAADALANSSSADRRLIVVCDRQAINWRDVNTTFTDAWKKRLEDSGPMPQCLLIPVGDWDSDNQCVESIRLDDPQVIVNQPTNIEVTIHNYANAPRTAIPLTISAGEHEVGETVVNLEAQSSVTSRLTIKLGDVGSQVITAKIPSSSVKGDETCYLAVDVVPPMDVLVIRPTEQGAATGKADYLTTALMPYSSAGRSGPDVAAVHILPYSAEDEWPDLQRGSYRVVVLDGVAQLAQAQARSVQQQVYGGGGLLIVPGPATDVRNFNTLLYQDGAGIMPAELDPPTEVGHAKMVSLSGLDAAHPIFRFLADAPELDLSTISVQRYFPTRLPQRDARVIGRYSDGQPFAYLQKFGQGRTILLTTPLSVEWGSIQRSGIYLPMVQEMVRYLAAYPDRNLRPGQEIVAQFEHPAGSGDEQGNATVTNPTGQQEDVPLLPNGQRIEARWNQTYQPGVYTVATRHMTQHFVVGRADEEADITPLPLWRWAQMSRSLGFTLVDVDSQGLPSLHAQAAGPRQMWETLLIAVMVLAAFEVLLTKRFR